MSQVELGRSCAEGHLNYKSSDQNYAIRMGIGIPVGNGTELTGNLPNAGEHELKPFNQNHENPP